MPKKQKRSNISNEILGPSNMVNSVFNSSEIFKNFQSGNIFHILFMFSIFITIIIFFTLALFNSLKFSLLILLLFCFLGMVI